MAARFQSAPARRGGRCSARTVQLATDRFQSAPAREAGDTQEARPDRGSRFQSAPAREAGGASGSRDDLAHVGGVFQSAPARERAMHGAANVDEQATGFNPAPAREWAIRLGPQWRTTQADAVSIPRPLVKAGDTRHASGMRAYILSFNPRPLVRRAVPDCQGFRAASWTSRLFQSAPARERAMPPMKCRNGSGIFGFSPRPLVRAGALPRTVDQRFRRMLVSIRARREGGRCPTTRSRSSHRTRFNPRPLVRQTQRLGHRAVLARGRFNRARS